MKYKVGDKVKIREDLNIDEMYGKWDCAFGMTDYRGMIATITKCNDNNDDDDDSYQINLDYECYNWSDEMFENTNENSAKTVDIGYYLEYCGHRVIENVYYGGYAHDHDHVFCTTVDGKNQYTLPVDSIEFIIPHED